MTYEDTDDWKAGYAAGFAGYAYGPHDRGLRSYQGVAAYQRGYNAGWEDRIATIGGGSPSNRR